MPCESHHSAIYSEWWTERRRDLWTDNALPFPAKVVSCKLVENKVENRNPPTTGNGKKP